MAERNAGPAARKPKKPAQPGHQEHPFPPLFDSDSRVLILGSFPSVKSREEAFFYAHPQNRFWPVLAAILGEPLPRTVAEKTALLHRRHIALWDVVGACEIVGSSDGSITGVRANDLSPILRAAEIRGIFCNGGTAHRWYLRLCRGALGRDAVCLPSTSPANARASLDALTARWGAAILPLLE